MKVLLGLGQGSDAASVLERTAERTVAAGDDLTVAIGGPGSLASVEELEARARETLAEFDLDASVRIVEGDLGSRLVELAEQGGFDRIVLDGGDRSPMGKITISSTVEFVLLNARTSVTLLR
ncbi:MAG: universal stress protein [Haloferacaceae archaeon]